MPHRIRLALRLPRLTGWIVGGLAVVSLVALITYMIASHATETYAPSGWNRLWMVGTFGVLAIGAMFIIACISTEIITTHVDRRFEQVRTALVDLGVRVEDTGEWRRTGKDLQPVIRGQAAVQQPDNVRAFELGRRVGRQDPGE